MTRNRLIWATLVWLTLGGTALAGAGAQGRSGKKPAKQERITPDRHGQGGGVDVHVIFSTRDVDVLRAHYGPQYRNLPPGLRKKLARGGALPPGWEKKLQRFPAGLERNLAPLSPGYHRGVIDGHAVIYNRSGMVVDIAVLF